MPPSAPMGGSSMAAMRRMHQDDSVTGHKLAPGIVKRILEFARPYRKELALFLLLTVVSSVIGGGHAAAGRRRDQRDQRHGSTATVVQLALVIAGLAVLDAAVRSAPAGSPRPGSARA